MFYELREAEIDTPLLTSPTLKRCSHKGDVHYHVIYAYDIIEQEF